MNFNVFDPSQWADVTGFLVVMVFVLLTVVGVAFWFVGSAVWGDWLDEARGRGSVEDPWEDNNRAG